MGQKSPRLVVGVGASAGGLEAFKRLLTVLPSTADMAFLLVQHLDPTHDSLLTELLTPLTSMPVKDARQGTEVESNSIYIIRPDTELAVRSGAIEITRPKLHRGLRLPVDHLFRSLAKEYGSRAAAIVLSGSGSDGSAGIRDIKGAGGLIIVQSPQSCRHSGMPQSAIGTGLVDLELEIPDMPAALARFVGLDDGNADRSAENAVARPARAVALSVADLARLHAVLDAEVNFDVRVYKSATVARRLQRRMALSGSHDFDAYIKRLQTDSAEPQALVRDLLINVTEFFRESEAYARGTGVDRHRPLRRGAIRRGHRP